MPHARLLRIGLGLTAVLILAAAGSAVLAQPNDFTTTTIGHLRDAYTGAGYQCEEPKEGDEPSFIAGGEGKVRRLVGLRGGGTVVHCIAWFHFKADAGDRKLEAVNKANATTFIGKYYVDKDGDLAMEYSFVVDEHFSPSQLQATDARFNTEMERALGEGLGDLLQ